MSTLIPGRPLFWRDNRPRQLWRVWLGKEESRLSAAEGCPPQTTGRVFQLHPMTWGQPTATGLITGPGPSSSRVTLLHWVKPLQGEEARCLKQAQLRGGHL